MPALPPVARVLKIQVIGTSGLNSRWQNGFHAQYTGAAPDGAALNALATNILGSYGVNFGPLMPTTNAATLCKIADLSSVTSAIGEFSLSHPGTRVGVGMTAQVAAVVSWEIQARYRGGHPRSYTPTAVVTDVNTSNVWTTAFTNELNAAATAFRVALNGMTAGTATLVMGAVQYFVYGAHPPELRPIPGFLPIIGNVVHHRPDTVRRRLGKETG